ncbi:uncharacterized protein prr5l isoform X4 [Stigmatopora nigra]
MIGAIRSVQSAVMKVFRGGALRPNELYALNENVRRLLKSEMGAFLSDYFQNRLLAAGLAELLERVYLAGEEERLEAVSRVWRRFFTETLPTLQAIFYPVQGREPSVRQMALLSFRDAVVLQLPLEDSLANGGANGGGAPPDLTHMLLVLQVPTEGPTEVRTTGAQGLTRPFPAGGARARTVLRPTLPETGATGGRRGLAVPGRRGLGAASAFRVHRRGRLGFATRRGFVADAAAGARGRSLPGESGGGATSHGGQRAPGRGRNLTPARPSGRSGQMGTFWRRRFGYVFLFGSRRVEKQPRAKNKAKRVGSKLFQSFFCTLYTHAHTHTHGDTHTQVHVDARRPSILRSAAVCPSARLVQF